MYFIRCSEHVLTLSFWYSSVLSDPISATLAYTYNTTKVSLSSQSVTVRPILSARFSQTTAAS